MLRSRQRSQILQTANSKSEEKIFNGHLRMSLDMLWPLTAKKPPWTSSYILPRVPCFVQMNTTLTVRAAVVCLDPLLRPRQSRQLAVLFVMASNGFSCIFFTFYLGFHLTLFLLVVSFVKSYTVSSLELGVCSKEVMTFWKHHAQ